MHIDWKNKETTYCFRFGTAYNKTQPNKGMNGVLPCNNSLPSTCTNLRRLLIVAIVLGILIVTLGIFNIRTKNPILLHVYHRKNTTAATSESLAIHSGIGLILVGVSVVVLGVFHGIYSNQMGTIFGIILLILGIVYLCHSIIKYNGKLFS